MPNLYATDEVTLDEALLQDNEIAFGKSVTFDFKAGEFVLSPTGKFVEVEGEDAWIEWCQKAILTQRYRWLIYSRSYGQEFEDLIGSGLTQAAIKSEIERMVTEALLVDSRTASVENFAFSWVGDELTFSCDITSVRGRTATLTGSVVNQ